MVERRESDPLAGWRGEIDRIDSELLRLLNERARAALEIGRIKRDHDLPVYVPAREDEVLARLSEQNPGPLPAEAVQAVFRTIIAHVRALEETH